MMKNLKSQISNLKSNEGFTFVELLIVIVVIGILAVGAINVFDPIGQIQKAQDATRKSDLAQIQMAFDKYHQDYGKYPDAVANKIRNSNGEAAVDWGTSQWQPYMDLLPKDPVPSKNYVYAVSKDGQTYYLYASLDRGAKDSQVCNGGDACSSLPSGASCGTDTICNYGVSSPNVSP